jgi:twitching motility two-component system response regulator PilG
VSTAANFEGIKVVIIDEYKTIRRTAETLLKKAGCQVVTAFDGFEGFYRIIEFKPDIIFVGHHPIYPIYVMPEHRIPRPIGYQTCALIKSNQAFKSVPVIILSSCDGLFERARSQIVGATHYMTLPFTGQELLNVIKSHVVDVKKS